MLKNLNRIFFIKNRCTSKSTLFVYSGISEYSVISLKHISSFKALSTFSFLFEPKHEYFLKLEIGLLFKLLPISCIKINCIQEMYAPVLFFPFCPRSQLANLRRGELNVSNYPFYISVSGQI